MGSLINEFEKPIWSLGEDVVGIDEAGRGPMAGPCVVCGVVFPKGFDDDRINDSKKLSAKRRDELVSLIKTSALWYEIVIVDVETIDTLNIYAATQAAMQSISEHAPCSYILTDAMPLPHSSKNVQSIIKGDARSLSIAAASILAKTKRDEIMIALDETYPEYGFAKHKGYGTKQHKEAILTHGRTPVHRKSFKFKDETQISFDI